MTDGPPPSPSPSPPGLDGQPDRDALQVDEQAGRFIWEAPVLVPKGSTDKNTEEQSTEAARARERASKNSRGHGNHLTGLVSLLLLLLPFTFQEENRGIACVVNKTSREAAAEVEEEEGATSPRSLSTPNIERLSVN